jgi:hypothetical protein
MRVLCQSEIDFLASYQFGCTRIPVETTPVVRLIIPALSGDYGRQILWALQALVTRRDNPYFWPIQML